MMTNTREFKPNDNLFLPSFCHIQMVFALVVIGELLSLLMIFSSSSNYSFWYRFSQTSLYVQWIALFSGGALCVIRPILVRYSNTIAGFLSYLLVLTVAAAIAEITYIVARPMLSETLRADHVGFVGRTIGVTAIVAALSLRYLYLSHQNQTQVETQSSARIEALQARIRPHFLFNSMNTIASLIRRQPLLAENMVEDLADLFRASLAESTGLVPLADELDLTQRYLNIEKIRLGDRLTVKIALEDAPVHLRLPQLTLQPLLENAIYHGIEPTPEGGTVHLEGYWEAKHFVLTVRNPLSATPSTRKGLSIALDNTQQRLRLAFGESASCEASATEREFQVCLRIPISATRAPS